MKKLFLSFLFVIILPLSLFFSACDPTGILENNENSSEIIQISGIQLAGKDTISSDNAPTDTPSVNNPEIIEPNYNVDFYQIYQSACESGEFTGTYLEFIEEFFGISAEETNSVQYAANIGLLSAVSVYSTFSRTYEDNFGNIQTQNYSSAGAGVIYRLDKTTGSAYIITNYHVVYDLNCDNTDKISSDINVYLYGGEYAELAIPATYLGGSMTYDIAVLEVRSNVDLMLSYARPADFADSNKTAVGTTAIAIGNPNSEGISATQGIVCVDSEDIYMQAVDNSGEIQMRVMRIDTPVNSGNSGGGLYNSAGELIGIVNAKKTDTKIENISYAIPSNIAKYVADNIIDNCANSTNKNVLKCMLGVGLSITHSSSVYDDQTKTTHVVEEVIISSITLGGLAYGVLETGMIVKSISNGLETVIVDRVYKMVDFMLACRVGDEITVSVVHNGEDKELQLTLSEDCMTLIP